MKAFSFGRVACTAGFAVILLSSCTSDGSGSNGLATPPPAEGSGVRSAAFARAYGASVILPVHSDESFVVADVASKLTLRMHVSGARSVERQTEADGSFRYRGALGDGVDLIERSTDHGNEDFALYRRKPEKEVLSYDVDVTSVAGLRLVESTLEFLDASGTPRLRVTPPFTVDADGARRAAQITVAQCNVDTSPIAPWRRAVTPPANSICTVAVTWSGGRYPMLVDPEWTTTGSLIVGRNNHTTTTLANGKVLVVGGQDGSNTYTGEAELFDPATGTFAATGSADGRVFHTATLLATGKVLVAGGFNGGTTTSAQLYDPTSGTFSDTGSMSDARPFGGASLLATGKVLMTGGADSVISTNTAEVYDPVAGTFTATGNMHDQRSGHISVVLTSGKVLVAGGFSNDLYPVTADIYDPSTGVFTATSSLTASHDQAGAVLLPSGKVLVAGSDSGGLAVAELYDPAAGTFTATGSMSAGRSHFGIELLRTGKVLVAGGDSSNQHSEVFDPAAGTWAAAPALQDARALFGFSVLSTGQALVTGGAGSLATAEIFSDSIAGIACKADAECELGLCVDGVCCNSACADECQACDVEDHLGTCTAVTGAPHGSREACAGSGGCIGTCNGSLTTTCTWSTASCGSKCASGSEVDSLCNGAGACVAEPARSCNDYACTGDACKTSCTAATDCAAGFICANGKCEVGGKCIDAHTGRNASGDPQDCAPYICDTTGACKGSCQSVADCISPSVCSPQNVCIPSSTNVASADSSGCTILNAPSSKDSPFALFLASALALALRRRRRNHDDA